MGSNHLGDVGRRLRLAFAVAASLVAASGAGAQGQLAAIPSLQARFERAGAISQQAWYTEQATLLGDVAWSREGRPILKNDAKARYEGLDAHRSRIVTLATFESLAQALRATGGADPRTAGKDVRNPLELFDSGVLVGNGVELWHCGFSAQRCEKHPRTPLDDPTLNVAPDRGHGLVLEDDNLVLIGRDPSQSFKLTDDGNDRITYGSLSERPRRTGGRFRPRVIWSDDGRYAAVARRDQTGVLPVTMTEWLPNGEYGRRAEQVTFVPRAFFGDAKVGTRSLFVVDTRARKTIPIPDSASRVVRGDQVAAGDLRFDEDGRRLYFVAQADDFSSARVVEFDLQTRVSRTVLTERVPDGGFVWPDGRYGNDSPPFWILAKHNALVWYSERDGYGHLYRYALDTGKVVRQLTSGPWNVLGIHRVSGTTVYFSGTSPESVREPYNRQLYAVDIATGKIAQLTDYDHDHEFSWAPRGDLFVQSSASMESPPELAVRDLAQAKTAPLRLGLSSTDSLAGIRQTGFQTPRRFRIVSSIAGRVVFGTIHRPSWAAADRSLPVIEKVYPGNCCVPGPWAFPHHRTGGGGIAFARFFEPQALAELGFTVVVTAGPGSPLRSRAYQQAQRGEGYWDADSLETHIDVVKKLAIDHPTMDASRVGIYGQSGGGYQAARAILKYPEFYQVAVAMAGNHDRRLYNAGWPSFYAGHDPNAPGARTGPENFTLAKNLRGHLLLMHGDLDNAVLIDGTLQLAAALQRANKKFDMQVIVGEGHGIDDVDYVQRFYWSYFLEHLRAERMPVDFGRD